MKRIAILGPGLLGGSIALGLAHIPDLQIRMWGRRVEVLQEASASGIASFTSTNVQEVVDGADTVILCVPVGVMRGLIQDALPALSPDALVTDVGSVKKSVVDELAPLLHGKALFVGSHPMAGSEKAGLSAAKKDLFHRTVCILTPEAHRTPPQAIEKARVLWETLGCRVRTLTPEVHDRVCAQISHVPHVAAAALVNMVSEMEPEAFGFFGAGFRDTTRVAAGLPSMWSEILLTNRDAVSSGLRGLISQLESVLTILEQDDRSATAPLEAFLSAAKERRDRLHLS
ncbi:MAG: prephenate dehydrogenase [Verrucomicrobiota bacterium]